MFSFLDIFTGRCLAVVYVDDGIITGPRKLVDSVFQRLQQHLDVTDLGEPEGFLGMHIIEKQLQAPWLCIRSTASRLWLINPGHRKSGVCPQFLR